MKVDILGTIYTVHTDVSESDEPRLKDADGITDFTTKDIYLARFDQDEDSFQNIGAWGDKCLRHELIHAFLFESGIDCNSKWGRDEEIVDWIAIQFPKIEAAIHTNDQEQDEISYYHDGKIVKTVIKTKE